MDSSNMLSCQAGTLIQTPCKGSGGCTVSGRIASCDISGNVTGDVCSTDDEEMAACTKDGTAIVACNSGKYDVFQCRGPNGCKAVGSKVDCDRSLASIDDACEQDDIYSCSVDKTQSLVCKGKKMTFATKCGGPKHCQPKGKEMECDESVQDEGAPCDSKVEGEYACSTDMKAALMCKGGKWSVKDKCPGGCSLGDNKVNCN
jgi:hypothetical protein